MQAHRIALAPLLLLLAQKEAPAPLAHGRCGAALAPVQLGSLTTSSPSSFCCYTGRGIKHVYSGISQRTKPMQQQRSKHKWILQGLKQTHKSKTFKSNEVKLAQKLVSAAWSQGHTPACSPACISNSGFTHYQPLVR